MLASIPGFSDLFLNEGSIIVRCKDIQQLFSVQGCESPWTSWSQVKVNLPSLTSYSSRVKVDQPLPAKSEVPSVSP